MWKCKHCSKDFKFETTSEKANHSRWCDCNPRRNNTNGLVKAQQIVNDRKLGKIKDFEVICDKCNISFIVSERAKKFPINEKYYCSRKCANSHIISDKMRQQISVKLSKPKRLIKCKNCNIEFLTKKKTQEYCSVDCVRKYKIQKALSEYDDLKLYRYYASFNFNLSDYKDEFDFSLIERYGWYKAKNRGDNQNGISRDHMISVKYGFENNIPTWIIKHPANCNLMRHKQNVSKNRDCDITLVALLEKIEKWNHKY